jgi:hypothetical protein
LVNVSKHYKVPVINPKYVALATLVGVSFSIYKPRISAVLSKNNARKPASTNNAAPSSEKPAPMPLAETAPAVEDWFAQPSGNA